MGLLGRAFAVAQRLDTDEASLVTVDALAPLEPDRQRTQLMKVVAAGHPDAEIRSFADAVANFVDSEHLIVAYYEDRLPKRRPRALGAGELQEPLF